MGTLSSRQIEPTLRQLTDRVDELEKKTGNNAGTVKGSTAQTMALTNDSSWHASDSKFTLPEGTWIVMGYAAFASNNSGLRGIRLYMDGVGGLTYSAVVTTSSATGLYRLTTTYPVVVRKPTEFRVDVVQGSNAELSTTTYIRAVKIA